MDAIFQQHREKLVDLRGNVEKAEIEMEPLVRADQPNESSGAGADRQGGASARGTGKGECPVLI